MGWVLNTMETSTIISHFAEASSSPSWTKIQRANRKFVQWMKSPFFCLSQEDRQERRSNCTWILGQKVNYCTWNLLPSFKSAIDASRPTLVNYTANCWQNKIPHVVQKQNKHLGAYQPVLLLNTIVGVEIVYLNDCNVLSLTTSHNSEVILGEFNSHFTGLGELWRSSLMRTWNPKFIHQEEYLSHYTPKYTKTS